MVKREISMLYVGDSSVIAYLHKHNYKKMGLQTTFSSDLSEAMRLLREKTFQVVVVNINSLSLDAADFVRYVKQKSSHKNSPLVATGISSSSRTRILFEEVGADLFLEQPIPLSSFVESVFELLGEKTRASERMDGPCVGSVFCYEDKALIECEMMNLSENGLLLRSPAPLSQTKGEFKIQFKLNKKSISVIGELIEQKTGKKEGVFGFLYRLKFLEILEADKEYIRNLVCSDSYKELAAPFYDE